MKKLLSVLSLLIALSMLFSCFAEATTEANASADAAAEAGTLTYEEIKDIVFNTMVDGERVFKYPKDNDYFSVKGKQFPCRGAMLLTVSGVSNGKIEIASLFLVFDKEKDPDNNSGYARITYWEVESEQQENVFDLMGESLNEYINFDEGGKLVFCMTQDMEAESQILFEYSPVIDQYSDKDVYKTQNYDEFDSFEAFRDKTYGVLYSANHNGESAPEAVQEEVPEENDTDADSQFETLQKGSKGDEVVKLQNRLNELGYSVGTADGDYGNKTKTAVENFQKDHGLTITGIVDEDTYNAIFTEEENGAEEDEASLITAGIKYISNSVMEIAPTLLGVSEEQCRITEIYYLDKGNNNYQFTARVSRGGPGGYGIGKDLVITSKGNGSYDISDSNHITMYGGTDSIPGEMIFGDANEASVARGMQILGKEFQKLDINGDGELSMDEIFKMN